MGLCEEQVREKRNRILIDWYGKLAKFEQNLSNGSSSSGVGSTAVLSSSGYFETSSPCTNSCLNSTDFEAAFPNALSEVTVIDHSSSPCPITSSAVAVAVNLGTSISTSQNLINLSEISSSQSSLNSCSSFNFSISPSSSSSSSTTSSSSSTSCTARTSSSHVVYSPDHFSLEVYLSTLKKTRSQLNDDFERKVAECVQLKENIGIYWYECFTIFFDF